MKETLVLGSNGERMHYKIDYNQKLGLRQRWGDLHLSRDVKFAFENISRIVTAIGQAAINKKIK